MSEDNLREVNNTRVLTKEDLKTIEPEVGDTCWLNVRDTTDYNDYESVAPIPNENVDCNDCNGSYSFRDWEDHSFECEECGAIWQQVGENWFELIKKRTDIDE